MNQQVPRPGMPGSLRTVQVIFIIQLIVSALLSLFFIMAASNLGQGGMQQNLVDAGISTNAQAFFIVWGIAVWLTQFYVVIGMSSRARAVQMALRAVIGIGFASLAYQFFYQGETPWLALGLHMLLLFLAESPSAWDWFEGRTPSSATAPHS
jgi:hypothetical protein